MITITLSHTLEYKSSDIIIISFIGDYITHLIIAAQGGNVTFVVTPPCQRHVRNACHIQMLYPHTHM